MTTDLSYAAVLTLRPKTNDGEMTIRLTLFDEDAVVANGHTKRLGDCTLAEIQAYADDLETHFSDQFAAKSLADLLQDDGVEIEFVGDSKPADWLNQIILLDMADEVATETAPPDAADEIVDIPVVEGTPSVPAETEAPEPPERDPSEVHVADPEPVFEEREVESTAVANTEAAKTDSRTAGHIEASWRHNNAVDILLDEVPLRQMQRHASSSLRREVAGMMLGRVPEKQPDGRYVVHVSDMIIAKHTKMAGASVTYTPESWRYINDELARRYPDGDMVMVGWYHTHPGFGIFLSNMDLFIHTNFFTQKWHIAYVLDPVGQRSGFFSWDRNKEYVVPYGMPWPKWAAGSW